MSPSSHSNNILSEKVKRLLIIDAIGALLSFVLWAIVIPRAYDFFGVATTICYFLALFPFLYFLWDIFSLLVFKSRQSFALKIVAYANVFYCITSLSALFTHYSEIRVIAVIYIILEVIIIGWLSKIELTTAYRALDQTD